MSKRELEYQLMIWQEGNEELSKMLTAARSRINELEQRIADLEQAAARANSKVRAWMSSKNGFLLSTAQKTMAIRNNESWHAHYDIPLYTGMSTQQQSNDA